MFVAAKIAAMRNGEPMNGKSERLKRRSVTKTPDEMAEEWQKDWWGPYQADSNLQLATRVAFVHGYQAAKDQLADASKVMLDMESFAEILYADMPVAKEAFLRGYRETRAKLSVNTRQNQWISVKERLPEIGSYGYSEDVLLLSQVGRMEVSHIEKVKRMVKWRGIEPVIETENGTPIEDFTHWMPLPEPPKEDK